MGRDNGTRNPSASTTLSPDSEYFDSIRGRDVETVTQSKNKQPRKTPTRVVEDYELYY